MLANTVMRLNAFLILSLCFISVNICSAAEGSLVDYLVKEAHDIGISKANKDNIFDLKASFRQFTTKEKAKEFELLVAKISFVQLSNLKPDRKNIFSVISKKKAKESKRYGIIYLALRVLYFSPTVDGLDIARIRECYEINDAQHIRTLCIALITMIDKSKGFIMADAYIQNEGVSLLAKIGLTRYLMKHDYLGGYRIMESALLSAEYRVSSNLPVLMNYFKSKNGKPFLNYTIDTKKLLTDALAKLTLARNNIIKLQKQQ